MPRKVVITGLGPVSGLGLGMDETWPKVLAGQSAIAPIQAFNASGFACRVAAEVQDFKVRDFVPKTYRKATKVMARDIEMAVAAADLAARDAGLVTKGTDPDAQPSYEPAHVGAHIGAGLIAADLDELTAALTEATNEQGQFDIHKWGSEGMTHLTPLWLLKYLPNMLACHVTIIHDAQGPSNTITCNEASGLLSLGESVRAIQRGVAHVCFCGGTESKLNPMAFFRQQLAGRLTDTGNDDPEAAVRPFDTTAAGTVLGEGGGIVILEAQESCEKRGGKAYAQILGFGASQSVNREKRNTEPEADGRSIASAIRAALADGSVSADDIDLIVPFGCGIPAWDRAEVAALNAVFGQRIGEIPVVTTKPAVGNTGAGAGGLDIAIAAKAVAEQTVPAIVNRDNPLDGLGSSAASRSATIRNALVYTVGFGGQNAAVVLGKV